jgi:hypothetical protein
MGLPLPTSVVSNGDANVLFMLGKLNELGEDLQTRRESWFNGSFWVDGNDGSAKQYISRDNDSFTGPDSVPLAWLKWKYKADKGLEYAEDFAQYERLVSMWVLDQSPKDTLDAAAVGGRCYEVYPWPWSLNQAPWLRRR